MKGVCVNFLDLDLFFDSFRDVAMAIDLGKISEMTFVQHARISQQIRISQLQFRGDKGHNFYRVTAMLSAVYAVVVCLSVCLCVCLSNSCIVSKWLNIGSRK